jgi:alanine racemase
MRPSWIEIDLAAVRTNVASFVALVGSAQVCAVVKADGYGHGDVPVAEAALDGGATCLAVAMIEEGIRLREAGIEAPILVLSEPAPEDVPELLRWAITPTVYRHVMLERLLEVVTKGYLDVHVKVDTGMHRVGADGDRTLQLAMRLADGGLPVRMAALWTHFAVADTDPSFTSQQIEAFTDVVEMLADRGIAVPMQHLANSAGAILHPDARRDMVRVGLGMYGLYPSEVCRPHIELTPAMRVVSHVSMTRRLPAGARPSYGRRRPLERPSTVVTAPIGYADGVPRMLSQRGGSVLIGGVAHPFAGTVTMDQIVIDVGDDPVRVGDEVVLIGAQGAGRIGAEDWADRTGTINYEIVTRMGTRLPRRYP